jgi:phosphatidylserine/phosphatidylglycerophosphate/cardiolipin synthase-like enzyme
VDRNALTEMLRETLEDHRMSRGERKALHEVLEDMHPDDRDLDVLRSVVFDIAREEAGDERAKGLLGWVEDAVKLLATMREPAGDGTMAEAAFSPGKECLRRVTGALAGARETADLCVFTITDDRISRAVKKAHERGVAVRVITDDEKVDDLGGDVPALKKAGIPVVTDHARSHMHHKFAVIDKALLLTGSFNWTRAASEENQENLIVTDDHRLVRAFSAEFARLWDTL